MNNSLVDIKVRKRAKTRAEEPKIAEVTIVKVLLPWLVTLVRAKSLSG